MATSKIIMSILTCLSLSTSYASFKQHIKSCVHVTNKDADKLFYIAFVSTDIFDFGSNSFEPTNNGYTCAEHTYQHGPKTIARMVVTGYSEHDPLPINYVLDGSCYYLNDAGDSDIDMVHKRTAYREELWDFFIQKQNNKFYVSCEHFVQ